TRVAVRAGRSVAGLSRRLGTGEGSVIGGRITLALDPGALPRLAAGRRAVLVSGTNGKTTTTRLLVAALGTRGPVTTNAEGADVGRHRPAVAAGRRFLPRVRVSDRVGRRRMAVLVVHTRPAPARRHVGRRRPGGRRRAPWPAPPPAAGAGQPRQRGHGGRGR